MQKYALSVKGAFVLQPAFPEALRNSHLRCIELSYSPPPAEGEVEAILAALTPHVQSGLLEVASIHLPFYPWNCSNPDEAARQESSRLVADLLERFRPLGFTEVTVHPGDGLTPKELRPIRMAQMKKTITELLPRLEAWGVSLNLELLPRDCIGNCEEELLAMIAPFPAERVNLCFDVNHLMGRYRELPEVIARLAPRIHSFHLSDYDGVDECHWQVGLGLIDWSAVMKAIRALPRRPLLIFESGLSVLQDRPCNPIHRFRAAEHEIFLLERADQLEAMKNELFPRA